MAIKAMQKKRSRSMLRKAIDNVFFPLRALFIPEKSCLGLTSLRDERFEFFAQYTKGRVLDIGCGKDNLFIREWCNDSSSVGIDCFDYGGHVEVVHKDLTKLPFDDESFDTVTLIAVGGHIPQHQRASEFTEIARVLKKSGVLLMSEGEPVTQTIGHRWRHFSYALLGKKDMDTERGMEDDEQYCMPTQELIGYLSTPPLYFKGRLKFMWRLNNLYMAQKL